MERQLRRALFRGLRADFPPSNLQLPVSSLKLLQSYRWREPLHQVIFDVLATMQGAQPEIIREQLPAHLTRRGFPDFDLTWLRPHSLTGREIERLIDQLSAIEGPRSPRSDHLAGGSGER